MRVLFEINNYEISQLTKDKIISELPSNIEIVKENPEYIICIGGDGTLLRAIKKYWKIVDSVNFIAIHSGTLGFYSEFSYPEINQFLDLFLAKKFNIKKRATLNIKINNKEYYSLNDFRIESIGYTLVFRVFINGEFLEEVHGNGFNFCTQSGSTAYNKSLGGSIIWPTLDAFQMKAIAPISNNAYSSIASSIVLGNSDIVTAKGTIKKGFFAIDNYYESIKGDTEIKIKISKKKVRFVEFTNNGFSKRIKDSFVK